jgi:sphinganine C4-monooxygenase
VSTPLIHRAPRGRGQAFSLGLCAPTASADADDERTPTASADDDPRRRATLARSLARSKTTNMAATTAAAALVRDLGRHVAQVARERLHPGAIEFWMPLLPVVLYWCVAGLYDWLDGAELGWAEKRRLRPKAEALRRNSVTRGHVVGRVLLQHAVQCAVAWANALVDPAFCDVRPHGGLLRTAGQFALCMFVFDAWQYLIHRLMHEHKGLYNAVHSTHHRLLVCYAAGALYNHPLEAFLLDTVGALATVYASGAPCGVATAFFCFATVKTVTDHCGYDWPVNPLAPLFRNNARYHDVHHDPRGFRKNYSQPFFTHWDWLLGTRMDPEELARMDRERDARRAAKEAGVVAGVGVVAKGVTHLTAAAGAATAAGAETTTTAAARQRRPRAAAA